MLGKLLMAGGVMVSLLGSVVLAAIATGTQMAHTGYQASVQHYADQNATVGNPLGFAIIAAGAAIFLVGLVLTLLRRTSR